MDYKNNWIGSILFAVGLFIICIGIVGAFILGIAYENGGLMLGTGVGSVLIGLVFVGISETISLLEETKQTVEISCNKVVAALKEKNKEESEEKVTKDHA